MNTYIFLYNESSLFEVIFVAYFMKTVGNVFIVTDNNTEQINVNEGIRIISDISIDEINLEQVDVFIVCGGETENIKDISKLYEFIRKCNKKNKILGGICAGSKLILNALGEKGNITFTKCINNNIVLSPGNEFVDFALNIGKLANIYTDEADYQETIKYFKNFEYIE